VSDATARDRGANRGINTLYAEDRAVHAWYRFVLSFPPHLVRDYLDRFGMSAEHRVLDPFCGTGTVLVECAKRGIPSVGVEANPVAHFATATKIDWTPPPAGLADHAAQIAAAAKAALGADGLTDTPSFAPVGETPMGLRTLPAERQDLLLAGSISPLPLHKTLVLIDAIEQHRDDRYYRHERLALATTVVHTASNLRFGPEVGVSGPKQDAAVINPWLHSVEAMAADLQHLGTTQTRAVAYHADARQVAAVVPPASIDAVFTSPPYPNEKDYTRTTRLESVLLGFIRTKADLRAMKKGLLRSNTRGVYSGDNDDQWVEGNAPIQEIAEDIEARRIELGKTSGFERLYARVTRLYFGGMSRHLAQLRQALRPGAYLGYVVGDQASYLQVMIPTGPLLAAIAHELGYDVVGIDLFRTRLATATRAELREEVVVLRWSG
jgi:DNA modification methylase